MASRAHPATVRPQAMRMPWGDWVYVPYEPPDPRQQGLGPAR
jgi:hypothetical protein